MPEEKKPEDKLPEDPPEVWEQKGDTTPGAEPPAGVRSDDVPDPIPHPNFVPADPIPIMQHEPLPEAAPATTETPPAEPTPTVDYTPDEPTNRRGRHS